MDSGSEPEKVTSIKLDTAVDAGRRIKQTENGERGDRFSGAGFADKTEGLAFGNFERQAADGCRGAEMDGEIIDAEQKLQTAYSF